MRNRSYENNFDLHEWNGMDRTYMQNSFLYERFRTLTRFETEAQENSEMAYCFIIQPPSLFSYFNHFLTAQGSDLPFFS